MGKQYNQITHSERSIIASLLKAGWSQRAIAKELDRAPSSVSREISRNFGKDLSALNLSQKAQRKSAKRKQTAHKLPRLKNQFIRDYVEEKIKLGWSPEQIAGRITIEHPEYKTNHESIYLYLFEDARHLLEMLPRKRKHRKRRTYSKKRGKREIPNAVSIEQRNPDILGRNTAGHWEVDTAYSALSGSNNALRVLVERKSRLLKISKLKRRTAKHTRVALVRRLKPLPSELTQTLTFDNGTENSDHLIIASALNAKTFFCHPYASFEKGSVENSIGLIRRVLPKGTNFDNISHQQIRALETLLNSRPRK